MEGFGLFDERCRPFGRAVFVIIVITGSIILIFHRA
jgi:hypothetical protein